jgi:hypothetical protein
MKTVSIVILLLVVLTQSVALLAETERRVVQAPAPQPKLAPVDPKGFKKQLEGPAPVLKPAPPASQQKAIEPPLPKVQEPEPDPPISTLSPVIRP